MLATVRAVPLRMPWGRRLKSLEEKTRNEEEEKSSQHRRFISNSSCKVPGDPAWEAGRSPVARPFPDWNSYVSGSKMRISYDY